MSDRVLRSNSTPVVEEIELSDTDNGLVGHVVAPEGPVGRERRRIGEEVVVELMVGVVDEGEGEFPIVPQPKLNT